MSHTFRNRDNSAQASPLTANPSTFNHTPGARATVIIIGLVIAGATARTGGAPTIAGITATQLDSTRIAVEQNTEFWYVTGVFDGSQIAVSIPNTNAVSIHWECISADAGTGFTSKLNNASGNVATGNVDGFTFNVTSSASGDFLYSRVGSGEAAPASITETSTNPTKSAGSSLDHGAFSSKSAYANSDGAGTESFVWVWNGDDGGGSAGCFKSIASIEQVTETDLSQAIGKTKNVNVAQVTESETAQAITVGSSEQQINVDQATEAEVAQALTIQRRKEIGQAGGVPESIITYGDMESANWADEWLVMFGATLSQSTEQIHGGSYSLKIVSPGAGEGAQQNPLNIDQVVGHTYQIEAYIYILSGNKVKVTTSEGQIGSDLETQGEWLHFSEQYVATGTGGLLRFLANVGATTFYVEDVAVFDLSAGGAGQTDFAQIISSQKRFNIGQATETELAQTITVETSGQQINVIQVTETNTPQSIAIIKSKSVSQSTEAEEAFAIAVKKNVSVVQVAESNEAQTFSKIKYKAVDQVTETNLSQSINQIKFKALNQVAETDSALTISIPGEQNINVVQAAETDSAQAVGKKKLINVYPVGAFYYLRDENGVYLFDENGVPLYTDAQSDFAQAVSVGSGEQIVAQVTEADTAQSVGKRKAKAIAQVSETDLAQAVGKEKYRSVTQVIETDAAQTISLPGEQNINVVQVVENDSAQEIGKTKYKSVAQVTETDSTQAIAHKKNKIINLAAEVDESGAINVSGKINQVMESDTAFIIRVLKKIPVAQVTETDIVQTISKIKSRVLAQLTEVDLAGGITVKKYKQIQQASENDFSQLISILKKFNIGLASELDVSNPLYNGGAHLIDLLTAVETDKAFTIRDYDIENMGLKNIKGYESDYNLEAETLDYELTALIEE
jgi:hypothetical protein